MKHLLFFALLTLGIYGQAQHTDRLYAKDSITAQNLAHSIVSQFSDTLVFTTSRYDQLAGVQVFSYVNKTSEVSILFTRSEGSYFLYGFSGKLADLFPFWKSLDHNANQGEIVTNRESEYIKYEVGGQKKRIQLLQDSQKPSIWIIEVSSSF